MIVVFMLIGLFVAEFIFEKIYISNWDKGLTAIIRFEDTEVSEGEEGNIVEELENRKALPLPVTMVSFELDNSIWYHEKSNTVVSDKQYRYDGISLYANKRVVRKFKVTYTKRGVYSINGITIKTKEYFKDVLLFKQFESDACIYVFPAYSQRTDILAPFSKVIGEALQSRFLFEDPFEFKGIRDYTGTEPMKKINWRASAKTGEIMVNNYYDTNCRNVTIILDIANYMIWQHDDQLEECIRIVRNYIEGLYVRHIPVTLITNGKDIFDGKNIVFENGTGSGFVESCLRKLARLDIHMKNQPILEYFLNNTADKDQLTILLSVDNSTELLGGYEKYLGKRTGEWIMPLYPGEPRTISSKSVHVTYVEVSR